MLKDIVYAKRSLTQLQTLRKEFNRRTRKLFLNELAQNTQRLKKLGFSETDILRIQNGRVPKGWQIHHKIPLDDSGENSFDNLVLIQNDPCHKVITNYQNAMVRKMKAGDILTIPWPIVDGTIYPMKH